MMNQKPQIVMIDPSYDVVERSMSKKNSRKDIKSRPINPRSTRQPQESTTLKTITLMLFSAVVAVQIMPRDYAYDIINVQGSDAPMPAESASSISTSTVMNTEDYQLAYDQSYGFFDDIPSATWKLYQQRARDHENHANPNKPNSRWPKALPSVFYMNNYDPFFSCQHIRRLGGGGDGPKWTCDPHRLQRVAQERKLTAVQQVAGQEAVIPQQSNCLIYSFGCAGKYQWEEGLAQALMGPDGQQRDCQIHVFDFAGNFTVAGHADKYNIFFHQWGLLSTYDDSMTKAFPKQYPRIQNRMFSLEQVMQKLGHTGHVIDILKIDCEFCEWFSYKDWLDPKFDIRQLLLETHNLPTPAADPQQGVGGHWFPMASNLKPNEFFDDIERAGFAMYSKEPNIHPNAAGNGVEFAYIKLHPDFFLRAGA